jgi:hypothetical protein
MIESIFKSSFPSQVATDDEKASLEYGLSIGRAIESEWFKRDSGATRFYANRDNFHRLRLYARGEQSIKKYKDELSINGDLSYLNLDWKIAPIVPKFVDIVVNGMSDRSYELRAYAQDPTSVKKRTDYMESLMRDMKSKEYLDAIQKMFGVNAYNNDPQKVPEQEDELNLHMQLDYKQGVEIAQEEAISSIFDRNKYDLTKRRLDYDIATIGMACVKNSFNKSEGITIRYVDPADIVYSYTESPYFDDVYYVGEVKSISLNEVKKQFPNLSDDELKDITKKSTNTNTRFRNEYTPDDSLDANTVSILYFEFKTYMNQVYKVKKTNTGGEKVIEKDSNFNPPENTDLYEKVSRSIEVLYTGAKIMGHDIMLQWELSKNMARPKADTSKVCMSYNIVAPRMYKGKVESLVSRITGFADMIQLTHLKLQQVLARMVPDGVWMDVDGLAEIDLGNGTNYNPAEALNMYFQTGSIVGRSMTQDGDINHGKMPIQELHSNSGSDKLQSLISTYNYYIQMIRDATGLNEARDGSAPSKDALVGVQKLAAANSNVATRHILESSLYLTLKTAEAVSYRISDVLEFSPTKDSFISSLGIYNVGILEDIKDLFLYDCGIFLQLAPDAEEKQMLENNIQMSLQAGQIYLEDAIDIREIKNIKHANQLLKVRRRKKLQMDQQMEQQKSQLATDSNIKMSQAAAESEIHKNQGIAESKVQTIQAQTEYDIKKLHVEAEIKKDLMQYEFELNKQLKEMELQVIDKKDQFKEDRKDERTRIEASQQSKLIDQRQNGTAPTDFNDQEDWINQISSKPKEFESAGNDVLGGIPTSQFNVT